ncbi:hypothetical protein J2X06_001258 [Lysobacter niastensis]|uniref:Uncharacterized protein n=1 Tax=Lysobacter niastensis TaxID=380629 RepID=A0ABU1W924_9GAMM|nr:hypothetical protein [Lysobacter niastensis]MDR7134074.1 hypothetical protein [Lysobacter niastensis]
MNELLGPKLTQASLNQVPVREAACSENVLTEYVGGDYEHADATNNKPKQRRHKLCLGRLSKYLEGNNCGSHQAKPNDGFREQAE